MVNATDPTYFIVRTRDSKVEGRSGTPHSRVSRRIACGPYDLIGVHHPDARTGRGRTPPCAGSQIFSLCAQRATVWRFSVLRSELVVIEGLERRCPRAAPQARRTRSSRGVTSGR